MAKYPPQGIDEEELRDEINKVWGDALLASDKMRIYSGSSATRDDAARMEMLYIEHISAVINIETLLGLGEKYFPDKSWEHLFPLLPSSRMIEQLEVIVRDPFKSSRDFPTNARRLERRED
jgi:hypothetical protein